MNNDFLIQCTHCGMYHSGICPKIKSIEYHENGNVKKIEYKDDYYPSCKDTNISNENSEDILLSAIQNTYNELIHNGFANESYKYKSQELPVGYGSISTDM